MIDEFYHNGVDNFTIDKKYGWDTKKPLDLDENGYPRLLTKG